MKAEYHIAALTIILGVGLCFFGQRFAATLAAEPSGDESEAVLDRVFSAKVRVEIDRASQLKHSIPLSEVLSAVAPILKRETFTLEELQNVQLSTDVKLADIAKISVVFTRGVPEASK